MTDHITFLAATTEVAGVSIFRETEHRPGGELITEQTLRKFKNILGLIPGCPTSARLGEVIAAGWGFTDYHDLKTTIDQVETSFLQEPEGRDVQIDALMERLASFGCEGQAALDIGATFLSLNDGSMYHEAPEEWPEVEGGRAIRFDILSDRKKAATKAYFEAVGQIWDDPSFLFRIRTAEAAEDEDHNYWRLQISDAGEPGMWRAPDNEDDEQIEEIGVSVGTLPVHLFEQLLQLVEPVIPEVASETFECGIVLDRSGLRIQYGEAGEAMNEIVLVDFSLV